MVHDVLGMQSNSITVEEKGGAGVLPGASTKKRYEVSLDTNMAEHQSMLLQLLSMFIAG